MGQLEEERNLGEASPKTGIGFLALRNEDAEQDEGDHQRHFTFCNRKSNGIKH